MTLESLIQVVLSGFQVGGIYALMGLSYYIIISATDILNFAQGEWAMVAAVIGAYLLGEKLPYPLVIIMSIAGATTLSILSERLIIRSLERRQATLFVVILSLLGIMMVVRYGTGMLFGREDYPLPGPLGAEVVSLGPNLFILPQTLVVYGVTATVFIGVWLFMENTWLGRSLRIAAIDPIGAELVGVNLGRIRAVAFGIAGLIAAMVGWLYAPLYAAGFLIGHTPGIKGFIVMVIGGIVSPAGSLVGGLMLGVVEIAAARYLPSVYSEAIAFVVLMVVLFVRPSGLIGTREES